MSACAVFGWGVRPAWGHVFVGEPERACATPNKPGTGWRAQVYLNIPEAPESSASLLAAQTYIRNNNIAPDFTFETTYIDFPAGPVDSVLDTEVATIGDFLDDYITNVSDPAKLNEPMSNFLITFTGLVDVRWELNTLGEEGLPILLDFGVTGYGGFALKNGGSTIIRVQNHHFNDDNPFSTQNALVHGMGLFPIEVNYFNRYDPTNANFQERAGIEVYSYHPGGIPYPGGEGFFDPHLGYLKLMPPTAVYQIEDAPPLPRGDGDGDGSITLADFAVMQRCYASGGSGLSPECKQMDFDGDGDVGVFDYQQQQMLLEGPNAYPLSPGDFDANSRIDLRDYRWFQWCFDVGADGGEEEARAILPTGCHILDMNNDGIVDLTDYATFQKLLNGSGAAP